jgi:hypothetical protein
MLLVTSISPSLSFELLDVEFLDRRSGWEHDAWSKEEHLVYVLLKTCYFENHPVLEFIRYKGTKAQTQALLKSLYFPVLIFDVQVSESHLVQFSYTTLKFAFLLIRYSCL